VMTNYYNLRDVLHEYYPLVHDVRHLMVLHNELVVEIKKAQSTFESTYQNVPLSAFHWEKIHPSVRIHYDILKKGIDEHYGVSISEV